MNKIYRMTFLLALLAITVLAGCAKPQPPREKVYWPPPPAEPQMEWITTYASEDSFVKSDRQIAADKLFGKQRYEPFLKPVGVATLGDGVVFVADIDAGNIRAIDFNNKTSNTFVKQSPVAMPAGMTIDSLGNLFVADVKRKMVVCFSPQREILRAYGVDELQKPTFVALDEVRDRLYVSDVVANEVVAFDLTSGARLFAFGGAGSGAGQLFGPQGLDVDSRGHIFVAEQLNSRVQVFDSEGQALYSFGKRGDKAFELEAPRGLALDSQDNVFVSDLRKSILLIFQADGTPLGSIGGRPSKHPLEFVMPNAVFIDANDRIYISDGLARRITIWQMLTPAYLAEQPLDREALHRIEERLLQLQKDKNP